MNDIALTLLEAKLTLYVTQADGSRGAPVWSGAAAEGFKSVGRWLNVETRPTGRRFPKQHPLVPQYQLSIDRLWALPLTALNGFHPTEQTYIMEVLWTDEDDQRWHRRVYYGVSISEHSLGSRDIESGHTDGQEFLAEYFVPDNGANGTVPAPVVSTPAYVLYRGADGLSTVLYSYTGGVFVGSANALATIAADGSTIAFGSDAPVVSTSAGALNVVSLHDVFPDQLPRLEFYSGPDLLAAVTADGFWARSYADGYAGGDGVFNLKYAGDIIAVLLPGVTVALGFNEE